MDIVEQLAQQAAEAINGGEFYDGKWYTEGQRQAWRKALTPAADEIERLQKENRSLQKRIDLNMLEIREGQLRGALGELIRTRQQNVELVEALTDLYEACRWEKVAPEIDAAKSAIAKATGDE